MTARNAAAVPLTQSLIKGMSLLLKSRDAPLIAQAHSCGNQRHRQSIQASNASIRAKQLWRDFGECGGNEAKLICVRSKFSETACEVNFCCSIVNDIALVGGGSASYTPGIVGSPLFRGQARTFSRFGGLRFRKISMAISKNLNRFLMVYITIGT
ncbi:MAG: hypothetical protein R3C54_05520 [Parvularculaceae bacterium]